MDKQSESSQEIPTWNLALSVLLSAYGIAGYYKVKNVTSLVVFGSMGCLYTGSSLLIYSGHSSKGHAVAIAPSLALFGAAGYRAVRYAGWQAPGFAVIGALATFHNGKKLIENEIKYKYIQNKLLKE